MCERINIVFYFSRMNKKNTSQSESRNHFLKYIFSPPQRNQFFILSGVYLLVTVMIAQFFAYPFANPDTGNYVLCAQQNIYGGYRPMGYSWFLRFFHGWNDHVKFIYVWQATLNYIALISFVFTVKYFFNIGKIGFYVFALILLLHPDLLKLSNTVLSDSVFNSLTFIWITTGIWMIMSRSIAAMVIHFIVLYLAINVRYIGLFYPVVSTLFILLDFRRLKFLSIAAIIPIIMLTKTISDTKSTTEELYGYETFSAFSGWALANNAVSIIPYIDLKPEEIPDPDVRVMHQIVTSFDDTCYAWYHIKDTDFMWDKQFPGKALLGYNIQKMRIPYNYAWIYTGMQWNDYGSYLRKKYPGAFFSHFIIPNMGGVFEVFPYGEEKQYVPDNTSKEYFEIGTDKYVYRSDIFNNLYIYRVVLYYAMLILFIAVLVMGILKRKKIFNDKQEGRVALFAAGFILLYAAMSVATHPIQNFRYLIPVYPVAIMYIVVFGQRLMKTKKQATA